MSVVLPVWECHVNLTGVTDDSLILHSSVVAVCSHTGFQGELGISATRKRKFEATRSIKNSLLPSPVARRWRFTFYVARSVHVKVHASNIVFFKSTQNTGHRCHHILQNANDINAQTDTYRTKQIEKEQQVLHQRHSTTHLEKYAFRIPCNLRTSQTTRQN